MGGYAGKILSVDLTRRRISSIPTSRYAAWVGGHGMGSAIFFDLVKDKTIDGFDPENVVTLMTSPLTGTLVPGASGRTEVQGIGVQSYPIGWFTRSNFGGRFAAMLKYAGWDGIVLQGRSESPVWVDIRNGQVVIRDAARIWGLDTWRTQEEIWDQFAGGKAYGDWIRAGSGAGAGVTTQRPAVLTIGPAGENKSRLACLIHDASNAAGQGGFGAVWGAKNLKAISVIGTGDIPIHDPRGLMRARLWQTKTYGFSLDDLGNARPSTQFQSPPVPIVSWREGRPRVDQRPQACVGCHSGCRARYADKLGNEASCFASVFYWGAKTLDIQRTASDLINRYGVNAAEMCYGLLYLGLLHEKRDQIADTLPAVPLSAETYGSREFVEQFVKMVAYGDDGRGNPSQFGADISQGFVRAAEKWGRLEEDLGDGTLLFPYWGLPIHKEPRAQVYWAYGTILGDRDINEHDFDWLKWDASIAKTYRGRPQVAAEEAVRIITDKMVPYEGDTLMMDFSDANMYSEHMAKLVAWHRYYTRFWKQSTLFCDFRWPDLVNPRAPGKVGSTGAAEPTFLRAVTGRQLSFLEGIHLGRKIWNLDHAIWTLQGRHRDMVRFADFVYTKPGIRLDVANAYLPGRKDGKWDYHGYTHRSIDRDKFEGFKSRFYRLQGWDEETGYPTRATLGSLGLESVADELEAGGRLGRAT